MMSLVEPNLHPLIVHFAIALLITGPIFLVIAALRPNSQRDGIQVAGDWMFFLGLVSALAAIGAGLQAYYSVQHDGPSHAAMTDHRNWAFVTAGLFLAFGVWRYLKRNLRPSTLFAVLLLIPVTMLGVTGWKGGHLVYSYGLGVSSLPAATGDGHDHEHAEVHAHTGGAVSDGQHDSDVELLEPVEPAIHHIEQELPETEEHDHSTHDH